MGSGDSKDPSFFVILVDWLSVIIFMLFEW